MRILRWPLAILVFIILTKTEPGFYPFIPMLALLTIRKIEYIRMVDWDMELRLLQRFE